MSIKSYPDDPEFDDIFIRGVSFVTNLLEVAVTFKDLDRICQDICTRRRNLV